MFNGTIVSVNSDFYNGIISDVIKGVTESINNIILRNGGVIDLSVDCCGRNKDDDKFDYCWWRSCVPRVRSICSDDVSDYVTKLESLGEEDEERFSITLDFETDYKEIDDCELSVSDLISILSHLELMDVLGLIK